MTEAVLKHLLDSEKFHSAYSMIGELAGRCYGSKIVEGEWYHTSHDGTPLTGENLDAVLDAPFDDTWNNPFGFKNFGEALDFTESVFTTVRKMASDGAIDTLALRRLFVKTDAFIFAKQVHPLSMRRKNPPPDAVEQDEFWRSTIENIFE